jgi:hypothetical protein
MSRRFGRNQRRRARESIAALEQTTSNLRSGMAMDRGLLAHQSEQLRELKQQIADAKAILGPYHVAFPAEDYKIGGAPHTPVGMHVLPRLSGDPWTLGAEIAPTATVERVMLSVLGLNVYEDVMTHMRHAQVLFDGAAWAYGITRQSIESTPRDILIERIARELARRVAEHFYRLGKSGHERYSA